ncbi:exosome component 10 [Topomyia yanbarensis]|uniref:exosome component 10 n=1 Tax=Topomyia yanbarensis TaxID=2498891 RepID=UPI00273AE1C6|nr:exosome component 10 [Topomyia yanbarensis]
MKHGNKNQPSAASNGAETSSARPVPPIDSSPIRKYTDNGQKLLLDAMRAALALPAGKSRDLYSTHPSFVRIMDRHANSVLHTISDVLKMQEIKGNIVVRDHEEKFELLQEFNDTILERINSNLDEIAGIKKKHETVLVHSEIQMPAEPRHQLSGTWNNRNKSAPATAMTATLITGTNIARPQINFKDPVDNSPLHPFVPKIKDKPNSIKPLAILPEYDEAGNVVSYLHPYEVELDRFEPSKEVLKPVEPTEPLMLEDTPLSVIDKHRQIPALLNELKLAKELAIDLEHHSYRTFQGFTCLMQISTRSKDYIIDALALREELQVLNEVFTDPKVVKVLHGSICDIEWLQRDLGLYIVNMFDTAEAAKVLEFSRVGLQFLLKHYCNIDTDKAYQLADWRIRPLPDNFIEYARKDTHYLLYIYDCMRNELNAKGASFLQTVYNKSTFLCKQRYEKPVINLDTIMSIYRRSRHVFDQRQMYAFREILYWRDKIARQEDESPGYVLPQHMALDIASKLPREMQGIIACCTPVPSLVRQHLHTLHQIILKARDIPLNKTVPQDIERQTDTRHKIQSTFDINNPLFCPHDTSHQSAHLETNLPTLLDAASGKISMYEKVMVDLLKERPEASVFEKSKTRTLDEKGRLILGDTVGEDSKIVKFIELYYQKNQFAGDQKANETRHLSYQDRKFNTPYERHLEARRNRELNEPEPVVPPLQIKEEVDEFETSTVVKQETKQKNIESVPLKTLKRREDRKVKRELEQTEETLDKIKFNDYEPAQKKAKADRQSKGDYPMQIKPFAGALRTNVNDKDAASDDNDDDDRNQANSSNNQTGSFRGNKKGKNKKKKFRKPGPMNGKDARQNSNKPVAFDYDKVDYSRFQGGSRPMQQHKGRGGKFVRRPAQNEDSAPAGEGSSSASMRKTLHPESRIAKGVKRTQKMFNFSSNILKKK